MWSPIRLEDWWTRADSSVSACQYIKALKPSNPFSLLTSAMNSIHRMVSSKLINSPRKVNELDLVSREDQPCSAEATSCALFGLGQTRLQPAELTLHREILVARFDSSERIFRDVETKTCIGETPLQHATSPSVLISNISFDAIKIKSVNPSSYTVRAGTRRTHHWKNRGHN
jgi:hypothetical protein